jgi:hypothetical protein
VGWLLTLGAQDCLLQQSVLLLARKAPSIEDVIFIPFTPKIIDDLLTFFIFICAKLLLKSIKNTLKSLLGFCKEILFHLQQDCVTFFALLVEIGFHWINNLAVFRLIRRNENHVEVVCIAKKMFNIETKMSFSCLILISFSFASMHFPLTLLFPVLTLGKVLWCQEAETKCWQL